MPNYIPNTSCLPFSISAWRKRWRWRSKRRLTRAALHAAIGARMGERDPRHERDSPHYENHSSQSAVLTTGHDSARGNGWLDLWSCVHRSRASVTERRYATNGLGLG